MPASFRRAAVSPRDKMKVQDIRTGFHPVADADRISIALIRNMVDDDARILFGQYPDAASLGRFMLPSVSLWHAQLFKSLLKLYF
mmetsp:Transcript_3666/g.7607  ORF Transcript_3666/g.7607 Transcript_3666/m.7607 type:complete len:85 (+) Transcript_3666:2096-2350(+)